MSSVLLIARRELGTYLRSMSGYVIIAGLLAIDGLLFNGFALGNGAQLSAAVLSAFFYFSFGVTAAAGILLSMRLLAEERQNGTIQLLYSSPVRDSEIILGKYLSAMGFLAIMVLATAYLPALIAVNGKISFGHVAAGYLGLMLVGSAALSIGIFGSSLTRSQVVAVITSAVLVVAILVTWFVARVAERPFSDILNGLALYGHFQAFQSGVIHLRDVVYYVMVTYVALFAATRVLEARRWK
jgi:ABC-2 type transport system permease protein